MNTKVQDDGCSDLFGVDCRDSEPLIARHSRRAWSAAILIALTLASAGCASTTQPHAAADSTGPAQTYPLPTFTTSMAAQQPRIRAVVGGVRATSCRYRYDPERGRVSALEQLQIQARAKGADGIVNLRSERISNTRSPCWHGFEVTGTAVVFQPRIDHGAP